MLCNKAVSTTETLYRLKRRDDMADELVRICKDAVKVYLTTTTTRHWHGENKENITFKSRQLGPHWNQVRQLHQPTQ